MPFKKGQSGNPAGKPKGTLSAIKGAQHDFQEAWKKCAGPKTAQRLMAEAIAKAFGYPVTEETFDSRGKLIKKVSKHEYHFEPLIAILPYIARKMPDTIELVNALAGVPAAKLRDAAKQFLDNTD